MDFNSRTSQEVRHVIFFGLPYIDKFQLTYLTRGTTYSKRSIALSTQNFNSRTSQEVRHQELTQHIEIYQISTHVPHKRYDLRVRHQIIFGWHFNSRTSQEVRRLMVKRWLCWYRFQLTYLTRGTTYRPLMFWTYQRFQLTYLTRGTTRRLCSN